MSASNSDVRSAKVEAVRRAFDLRDRHVGTPTGFVRFGELRHEAQLKRIALAAIGPEAQHALQVKSERGSYLPAGGQPQQCCLFHVIVAFEWSPGYAELIQLRDTFDTAADLLFDATDGMMTFQRITVGGPELLACADIQIFASNRLFPRAWVNGLHLPHKYQPIRIGRGYWRKNAGRADPWHTNLGPAVLTHEWLHYALGLKDDYVKVSDGGYAVPESSPVVNTLMANLESSELIGDTEWQQLSANPFFQWLIPAGHQPTYTPPDTLPAPEFALVGTAAADTGEERQIWLNWQRAGLSDLLDSDHCWPFVLIGKGDDDQTLDNPGRLIAQGSYEAHPEGYRIIGAREGAYLILVGHAPGADGAPKVLYSKITGFRGANPTFWEAGWVDATPEGEAAQLPLVALTTTQITPPYQVQVQIHDPLKRAWEPTLFALGDVQAAEGGTIGTLDGHVLLVAKGADGGYQLSVATFSIGGSPGASYPANPNPVPAGSSDGNAMIFFYDDEARKIPASSGPDDPQHAVSNLRIITVTNLLGPAGVGRGPRSYTFGVIPNAPLPVDAQGAPLYHPTLVLYFDSVSRDSASALKIHRLGASGWEALPDTAQREYAERMLVAAQLTAATAPGLFAAAPAPEYYRLFLV